MVIENSLIILFECRVLNFSSVLFIEQKAKHTQGGNIVLLGRNWKAHLQSFVLCGSHKRNYIFEFFFIYFSFENLMFYDCSWQCWHIVMKLPVLIIWFQTFFDQLHVMRYLNKLMELKKWNLIRVWKNRFVNKTTKFFRNLYSHKWESFSSILKKPKTVN